MVWSITPGGFSYPDRPSAPCTKLSLEIKIIPEGFKTVSIFIMIIFNPTYRGRSRIGSVIEEGGGEVGVLVFMFRSKPFRSLAQVILCLIIDNQMSFVALETNHNRISDVVLLNF